MFRVLIEENGASPLVVSTTDDAQIANLDAAAVLDAAEKRGIVGRVVIVGEEGELAWFEVKESK